MLEINQIHELGVAYLSILNTCICHCSFNNRKGKKEARFCDLWLNELTLTSRINELVPRRALTDVASRGVQAGGVPAIWRSVIFTFINICKEQQRGPSNGLFVQNIVQVNCFKKQYINGRV